MTELTRFVGTFHKALRIEMAAMRDQLGSFEVPLTHGRAVAIDDPAAAGFRYAFALGAPNEKLAPHMECTLRREKSEYLVKIAQIGADGLQLECDEELPVDGVGHVLVISHWFLYVKLMGALGELSPDYRIDNAMRLFSPFHQAAANAGEANKDTQAADNGGAQDENADETLEQLKLQVELLQKQLEALQKGKEPK